MATGVRSGEGIPQAPQLHQLLDVQEGEEDAVPIASDGGDAEGFAGEGREDSERDEDDEGGGIVGREYAGWG